MENPLSLSSGNSIESPGSTLEQLRSGKKDLEALNPYSLITGLGSSEYKAASDGIKNTPECICSPVRKIPRPPNAFILYRQHCQAQVVAQNPKLANPEVSKIIGDQWTSLTAEAKDVWKRLAEDEKQRHLCKYPGYRYQPRRASKMIVTGSSPKMKSNHTSSLCVKCNSRCKLKSVTSSRSFKPAPSISCLKPCKLPATDSTQADMPVNYCHVEFSTLDTSRPRTKLGQQHLRSHQDHCDDFHIPSVTMGKSHHTHKTPPHLSTAYSIASCASTIHGSRNLNFLASASENESKLLGQGAHKLQEGTLTEDKDSNIIMVPDTPTDLRTIALETQKPCQSHQQSVETDKADRYQSQAQNIKRVIMGIPFMQKIMVLGTICPALEICVRDNQLQAMHGILIVVEGADNSLREIVGTFVLNYLENHHFYTVQSWRAADTLAETSNLSEKCRIVSHSTNCSSLRNPSRSVTPIARESSPFMQLLTTMSKWHEKSLEIKRYLSMAPTSTLVVSEVTENSSPSRMIPIAIIPDGFSLTMSDNFALHLPIEDNYSPIDHWHWIATLWRGIIGPNLTILVTRAGRQELDSHGNVEVSRDYPAIIVRILEEEDINDKTLRRLGFEVLEFMTSLYNTGD